MCYSIMIVSWNEVIIPIVLVYVIVWLAVVFGINSVSNAGRKIVIVQGAAKHYNYFPACSTKTINSKYYS